MAAHAGGAPANFLSALSKLGASCALIAKVGKDNFGSMLKETLQNNGINTDYVYEDGSAFTALAFVTFDKNRDRVFSFACKPGADTMLRAEEIPYSLIEKAKVFHFGTLSLTNEPAKATTKKAVEYAKKIRKLISFDPNLRIPLWNDFEDAKREMLWGLKQADIVKISDDEVKFLWGISPQEGASKILHEYSVKLVYVTCGKDGCYYATFLILVERCRKR